MPSEHGASQGHTLPTMSGRTRTSNARLQLGNARAYHRRGGGIEPVCDTTTLELRSSPSTGLPHHGTTDELCASDAAWLDETMEEP